MTAPKLLVKVAEAADMLSVSEREVYRLMADGNLERRYIGKKGSRNYRITVESLQAYVDGLSTEPAEAS